MPIEKLICAIGNYGYDWEMSIPDPKGDPEASQASSHRHRGTAHVSEVWQRATDADADLNLDYDTLNPHFEYIDEDNHPRHVVWFLDAVTVLDELRGARALGLQTFALWRLGSEDAPSGMSGTGRAVPTRLRALATVQPGHDIDTQGDGEIIRITGLPQERQTQRRSRYRRARSAQEAHHR